MPPDDDRFDEHSQVLNSRLDGLRVFRVGVGEVTVDAGDKADLTLSLMAAELMTGG